MTEKFGKTWWGDAWLQALEHIDYANRIPRGARYARNGSVKEIKVEGNVVRAKVQGRLRTPYKVVIEIPKFEERETQRLIDALSQRPAIISNLLDRKLDAEVMEIVKQCGVRIFPKQWNDLRMSCSCPDWAVPCKHLAAVIYMLSREIDNNPFLVFEMHGVNLLEELAKRGIKADEAKEATRIQTMEELFGLSPNLSLTDEGIASQKQERSSEGEKDNLAENKTLERGLRIDFSRLDDHTDVLLRLLPDNPSFSTRGNFKETYATTLKKVQKSLQRLMDGKVAPDGLFAAEPLALTAESELKIEAGVSNLSQNIRSLLAINPDFLPDYNASVVANHQALFAAIHLILNGCVAPRIAVRKDRHHLVHWMAAEIDPQAKRIVDDLAAIVPADIVCLRQPGKRKCLYPQQPAAVLVSLYISQIISSLTKEDYPDDIDFLFFKEGTLQFNAIGSKEIPGAIKAWTDHLWGAHGRFQPVFSVEEDEDEECFRLHLAVADHVSPGLSPVALSEILTRDEYAGERFAMLRPFSLLSVLMPEVNTYINKGATEPIRYDYDSFVPFLLEVIPTVRMLDIKVFMPKSITTLLRPKPTIRVSRKSESQSMFGLADLLRFSWEVAIGDQVVSMEEFERMMRRSSSLLKFKGQFVYTSPDDLRRLHDALARSEQISDGRLLQAVLSGEYESAPIVLSDEVKAMIEEMTRQEIIPQPASLQATLRPYQERGYSWLYRNMRIGFGSILADDMGLGKTLQTITLLLKLKEEGALAEKRALIVVPTGLLSNWQAEIARFAPSLSAEIYHGNARSLKGFQSDILLTTYGMVRTDMAKLKKLPWRVMVIDEAQNIKNHTAQQSKAVFAIPADTHIALSGTPVENRLSEFWSIMNFANCGYLDSVKDFNQRFARPIQQTGDAACAERFRRITAPFMMRRMKTDKSIISDLPDKVEQNDYITLLPDQTALYQSTLDAAMATIESIPTDDAKQLFKREGLILQMILALKQICNHPAQYLKNGDLRAELSGKTETLLDTVESIVEAGEKVLIFTQFKEMGDMLQRFIAERTGRQPLFYHGGCSIKQRSEMVERFQTSRHDRVFILSLKAAGTGLNLTAASHVIHYDLWWNPAVEAQATDRAYRIGQNKNVIVHRFITRDTFEERIDQMIQQKRHLADMTVATGESWIGKLSNKELREVFG